MDTLRWSDLNRDKFAVFIRDLSVNLTNVKHMIEDSYKVDTKPKHPKKGKKAKPMKKKDIIIQQQTKLRLERDIKEDFSKLDYVMDNLNDKNPYPTYQIMKTDKGLLELKCRMLQTFWKTKKEHFPHVMNLYFQLVDKDIPMEYKELITTIQHRLDDTEYKLYMMKNLSHLLPPLNIHEPRVKKLDGWQLTVMGHIKKGESVIVKAPTSSGKSFVGLGAGVIHEKILYVCPAKPIAYQVGAHYSLMGYKVHYLLDNLCHLRYDDKTTIFVGVPSVIEDNLYKLGVTFDYAVFDEIHNLNKEDDGHIYENLIKLIRCPFLALSATIGNIEYLTEALQKIHDKPIHYVEYTKRFINQQKMIYEDGKLHKLHPLACIQFKDLTSSFLDKNLQFTPYDSAVLWEAIEEEFELGSSYDDKFDEMVEECSPDNYFNDDNKILTLDDTRDYETFIKNKLVEISRERPESTRAILSTFHKEVSVKEPVDEVKDIIQLFRECKKNECLPMLVFNTDTVVCKQLFTDLFKKIAKVELDDYPYHYDILEKKEELYTEYEVKRSIFIDGIKINQNSKDALTDKQTKLDRYDKEQQRMYEHSIHTYYKQCIHDCDRKVSRADVDKQVQIKNLKKELKDWIKYPSFSHIDVFQKHKDFCFTNSEPMTGDKIRSIRKEIQQSLGVKISYEHELFQMLKRGIGIYTEDMPDEYKWILQKLMDDKKIGIVISDRTLCLGIDLPIRSCCLLGIPGSTQFTTDDYLQMSGRAGRRGKDDRGNTIFYNVDYVHLMKGTLPDIVGSEKEVPMNYKAYHSSVDEVYKNPINTCKLVDTRDYKESSIPKLQWLLRYEDNVSTFIDGLQRWNKEVFQAVEDLDKELCILTRLVMPTPYNVGDIIDIYKKRVITNDYLIWKHLCKLMQMVYNSLRDKKYTHMKKHMMNTHSTMKGMILRYQGL